MTRKRTALLLTACIYDTLLVTFIVVIRIFCILSINVRYDTALFRGILLENFNLSLLLLLLHYTGGNYSAGHEIYPICKSHDDHQVFVTVHQ